jgi:hypothetical protein
MTPQTYHTLLSVAAKAENTVVWHARKGHAGPAFYRSLKMRDVALSGFKMGMIGYVVDNTVHTQM